MAIDYSIFGGLYGFVCAPMITQLYIRSSFNGCSSYLPISASKGSIERNLILALTRVISWIAISIAYLLAAVAPQNSVNCFICQISLRLIQSSLPCVLIRE